MDIVDTKPSEEIGRLRLAPKNISQMSATWDARYMAEVNEQGEALVFETVDGKPVSSAISLKGAAQVAISDGGRYVALGGESGAGVFESSSGKPLFQTRHLQKVTAIDLTPDGRYLAAASKGELRVIDAVNGKRQWKNTDFRQTLSNVAFSMDGKQLATGGEDPELRLFSTEKGEAVGRVPFQWHNDCKESREPCKPQGMAFSRDGRYVVLAATDKTIRVMDVVQNREIRVIDLPASGVYGILSSDDRFLATSSSDLMGRVFEVARPGVLANDRSAVPLVEVHKGS